MTSKYILINVASLILLFTNQHAQAQPAGNGGYSPLNSSYSNPNTASSSLSSRIYNWLPQSITNILPSYNSGYMPSSMYNLFQNNGLFNGTNYYVYPANGNPPDLLMAGQNGYYYLCPPGSQPNSLNMNGMQSGTANNSGQGNNVTSQPQLIIPNSDGSWSMYPPGYNPTSNTNTNDPNFQPEKIVPGGNSIWYVEPAFPGMPPEVVIANGNSTYNIYPPGQVQVNSNGTYTLPANGGTPERVVPMGAGQAPVQQTTMSTQAPMP